MLCFVEPTHPSWPLFTESGKMPAGPTLGSGLNKRWSGGHGGTRSIVERLSIITNKPSTRQRVNNLLARSAKKSSNRALPQS